MKPRPLIDELTLWYINQIKSPLRNNIKTFYEQLFHQTMRLDVFNHCCQVDLARCEEFVNGDDHTEVLRSVPRIIRVYDELIDKSDDRVSGRLTVPTCILFFLCVCPPSYMIFFVCLSVSVHVIIWILMCKYCYMIWIFIITWTYFNMYTLLHCRCVCV